jgi:hypothetical protein
MRKTLYRPLRVTENPYIHIGVARGRGGLAELITPFWENLIAHDVERKKLN